jgi:modulator of FtsH protease HflC
VQVSPGEAIVITRFGDPVRVISSPGLALKLPTPIENAVPVDLRLRTTSSGLHDVGTRDGLRILAQAYIAWQVPGDPEHVRQFLRAVRNQPGIAAQQLQSFHRLGSGNYRQQFRSRQVWSIPIPPKSGLTPSRRRCVDA